MVAGSCVCVGGSWRPGKSALGVWPPLSAPGPAWLAHHHFTSCLTVLTNLPFLFYGGTAAAAAHMRGFEAIITKAEQATAP